VVAPGFEFIADPLKPVWRDGDVECWESKAGEVGARLLGGTERGEREGCCPTENGGDAAGREDPAGDGERHGMLLPAATVLRAMVKVGHGPFDRDPMRTGRLSVRRRLLVREQHGTRKEGWKRPDCMLEPATQNHNGPMGRETTGAGQLARRAGVRGVG
jgi:hypothetical protein